MESFLTPAETSSPASARSETPKDVSMFLRNDVLNARILRDPPAHPTVAIACLTLVLRSRLGFSLHHHFGEGLQ